jgi:hypothetical protein
VEVFDPASTRVKVNVSQVCANVEAAANVVILNAMRMSLVSVNSDFIVLGNDDEISNCTTAIAK